MQVYDLLPQSELELITEYINAYGGIDGNGTYVLQPMDHILRFWNKNKEFLCTLLNGQLIIEKEIDIKRPEAIMLEDMENAMYNQDNPLIFVKEYNDTITSSETNANRKNEIKAQIEKLSKQVSAKEQEIAELSRDSLGFARNEIYARHGYIFVSDEWKDFFINEDWYTPTTSSVTLNSIEEYNVGMILEEESNR